MNHTWDNVAEPDRSHGDEAKVEGIKEGPVLPDGKDQAADAEKGRQEGQGQEGRQGVGPEPLLLIVVVVVVVLIYKNVKNITIGDKFKLIRI